MSHAHALEDPSAVELGLGAVDAQFVKGLVQQLAVIAERHPAVVVHRVGRVLRADPQHINLAVHLRGIGDQPVHRAERGAGVRTDAE